MKKILLASLLLLCTILKAQTTFSNALTPKQLLESIIVESGIAFPGIKFNGSAVEAMMIHDQAVRWQLNFAANPALVGYSGNTHGILLTTGNAMVASGPNDSPNKSQLTATPVVGDPDLALLSGQVIQNVAAIEFDVVAVNGEFMIDYIFGSEEYPENVNGASNDAFAIFINGPGITGPYSNSAKNIAIIPVTNTSVNINNVNNGNTNSGPCTNCAYYTNNGTGTTPIINNALQYDGLTKRMTAKSAVQLGGLYHVKIIIGNTNDNQNDSGLFLSHLRFEPSADNIRLIAFIDSNNNGIKDNNEENFVNGNYQYQLNNSGNITNISSSSGDYTLYDSNFSNTYDFSFQINPEYAPYYTVSQTNYNDISIAFDSGTQTLYFPITVTQAYDDVSITIIPNTDPIPGNIYTNTIVYKNIGPTSNSGTISFIKPYPTTIISVNESGTTITPNGFTYPYTLAPYETRSINVTMSIPPIPIVNINDVLTTTASISTPMTEVSLSNNTFTNYQTVIGSYDPNDKIEAHGEEILYSSFSPNDYLTYTIRFQNTGTAFANDVRLEDVIDAKLDPSSIRMVSASHNYVMSRINNTINWKFDNIQLPYASTGEEEYSMGYVTFQIKPFSGFNVGDIISNYADIYFDTNPAITTNTCYTEFVAELGTVTFNPENILIYPNPSHDVINIRIENSMENLESVVLYDIIGKTVLKTVDINSNQSKINVSDLAKGMYMVEITTVNKLKTIKKLIVK